ncbi:MAG: MFS transporter [Eubacteriales bacterium]|nr:MFS transporter [Eubacteriales bacterium]
MKARRNPQNIIKGLICTDNNSKVQKKTSSLRYAIGMFGTSIPINMFKTFAAVFYVDRLSCITFKQFAAITAAYTFLDAIDNPVYGFLSDRTRTPYGRRRPWLIIGAPLLVLCYIMFFNPPQAIQQGSPFAYVTLMYMLTGTLDSLINANYGALFPELFKSEQERAKTNAIRQVFQLIAMVLSIALTPVITDAIGFSNTAIIYGIIAVAVIWFMATGAHEDMSAMEKPKPKFFGSILAVVKNPKFWKYGITNAAFAAALSLVQAGVPFYVKYYLGRADGLSSTILLGVSIISAIVFIPVWFKIIKKFTVMPSWRAAFAVIAFGILPLYFTSTLPAAVAVCVLLGFGMAGVQASMDLVSAKILDEDAKKYGVQREGMYSSLLGVLNKASGLFVSAGYLIVDKIYGFESGDVPGNAPGEASRFLMVLFPSILLIAALLLSFWLKFKDDDSKNEDIEETDETVQEISASPEQ